jgi:hypothetical protein
MCDFVNEVLTTIPVDDVITFCDVTLKDLCARDKMPDT